ncbi:acetyl-CoA carboxylase, biotin carboxyl carrier protein [Pseudoclavibacter endophyticus]|uniref:Biotin carboxyl carrier protein of acetyl-CoA carboxylase n=1 Tax=Pseudoclavibacter endophyticus TaxID=1778590 RepID=A0A6H9WNH8_9MICO|nr:biotin/lipoyl-containing protein [Pseudoclavibacter endophyticus]KAB1649648.1 acetyl-CoA carboxylase biotin carboxyl carrier protein [Pseudoclavibacter endophyticus]GGA60939.1 acetyl-CoA carboxylase, biotin carboxyl carrier protein [Pseudoclavibacter endophyticus]
MTGKLASFLSDDDMKYLTTLIDSLERSGVDFFELKVDGLQVTLGKGEPPSAPQPAITGPAAQPVVAQAAPADAAPAVASRAASAPRQEAPTPAAAESPAGVEIVAPLMGVFYAQAEPGAPAFVTVGSRVTSDTTVGLVEVMKTFAPVPAGVEGTIVEVCVQDSELVEFGQRLFVVRLDGGE